MRKILGLEKEKKERIPSTVTLLPLPFQLDAKNTHTIHLPPIHPADYIQVKPPMIFG
jgi:hypothetical protein